MRKIKHVVFFGSPACRDEVAATVNRLHEGFKLMSGLQQPAHSDSPARALQAQHDHVTGMREVEDVVRDIAMALLGCEIEIP